MQNYSNNSNNSGWLTDEELFDIADSLLFEVRFEKRLDYLYNKYVEENGLKMFDAFIARFEQIKNILDKPLREELKDWNGYILQEKEAGRTLNLEGLPKLADLRRDQSYPTHSLFPKYWQKMIHISWQHVQDRRDYIATFKRVKETYIEIGTLSASINRIESHQEALADINTTNGGVKRLSHPQIAILHHINDWPINKNNASEIAGKYGQTSGQRLITEYQNLTAELVRTGRSRFRLKDYNVISPLIIDSRKAQYDKELQKVIRNNEK